MRAASLIVIALFAATAVSGAQGAPERRLTTPDAKFAHEFSAINGLRDFRLTPPAHRDPASPQAKLAEHFAQVLPLCGEVLFQDCARVLPFVDLVVVVDESGK